MLKFKGKAKNCIITWRYEDAPEKYKKLSDNGGDEDWIALVPTNYPHYVPWLENKSAGFGVCDISEYDTEDGKVYIGSHS